ncbi:MAG TPA: sensor histidine kinase N-terminal domain-containing protein, partial [Methylibium sp.]
RARWLARDLQLRLMLPLLAIVAMTAGIGAYTAQRLTDRIFDRWLLDAAQPLAAQVRFVDHRAELDLPPAAEAVLAYDEIDHVYFSVAQEGRHLAGQPGLPLQGQREAVYDNGRAYDASFGGQPVRVAAVQVNDGAGGKALALVAETTLKRRHAQQEILLMLLPMGGLLLATAAAIGIAVRRTIRPLEAIAARWEQRSHASLELISADELPRELTPFATALNGLLTRIRAMLAREQQFATTAAHQLRTPLAGLQLGLTRAAEAPDLAGTRAVLQELGETTQRTARLVQQLLALGRLDPEARGDLAFAPTDLVALAQDVGATYVDLALHRSISLELSPPAAPVIANVHPELFSEALGNLLDNALRYTPAGGRVLIEFLNDPPGLRVSDSGPGVPEDERETVFERFARGRLATGDGSGLGLAIVRDIAALHGASVSLERSAQLGGASVVLRFAPRQPKPAEA